MTAKDVLRTFLDPQGSLLTLYTQDLEDADLLVRPAPGANHIAWQIGHLLLSESRMLKEVPGAKMPSFPAGFPEQHDRATAEREPPKGFLTRDQYLTLYRTVRQATLSALEGLSETDLDREYTGGLKAVAPTLGRLFLLIGNHERMHSGQFSVVRRKLGKPVLF
jgi:hypothetical protein